MKIEKTTETRYSSSANFSGDRGRTVNVWVIVDGEKCAASGKSIRRSAIDGNILRGPHTSFNRKKDAVAWIKARKEYE